MFKEITLLAFEHIFRFMQNDLSFKQNRYHKIFATILNFFERGHNVTMQILSQPHFGRGDNLFIQCYKKESNC